MKLPLLLSIITLAGLLFGTPVVASNYIFGTVTDAQTGEFLSGVEFHTNDNKTISYGDGSFMINSNDNQLTIRHPGYLPQQFTATSLIQPRLQPFIPKALYLSYWAADSSTLRNQLQELIATTQLNALVIDLKSSRGDIAFRTKIPLARAVNAQKVRTLKDIAAFIAKLKQQGIYTIGRIVVFKDGRQPKTRLNRQTHTKAGDLWQDREGISWTDPYKTEVWDYNIAIAKEAASLGFDEIQFDYIRFPAKSDLQFSQLNTGDNRVAAIRGFLQRAKQELANYPVMTSANIFGYICWKHKDQKIGQQLIEIAEHVDYLSPMLYPSGFPYGVPGYNDPMRYPYEIVFASLQQAQQLSGLPAVRFRPWLQAFKDYTFDRRRFGEDEISAQIKASNDSGSNGWMLWNASSRFHLAGLPALEELNIADASKKGKGQPTLNKTPAAKKAYPLI